MDYEAELQKAYDQYCEQIVIGLKANGIHDNVQAIMAAHVNYRDYSAGFVHGVLSVLKQNIKEMEKNL